MGDLKNVCLIFTLGGVVFSIIWPWLPSWEGCRGKGVWGDLNKDILGFFFGEIKFSSKFSTAILGGVIFLSIESGIWYVSFNKAIVLFSVELAAKKGEN